MEIKHSAEFFALLLTNLRKLPTNEAKRRARNILGLNDLEGKTEVEVADSNTAH